MTRLVEAAPASEIFPTQPIPDNCCHRKSHISIEPDCLFAIDNEIGLPAYCLIGPTDHKRIPPPARATDVDCIPRQPIPLRSLSLQSYWHDFSPNLPRVL
jgi:hypothetical protein